MTLPTTTAAPAVSSPMSTPRRSADWSRPPEDGAAVPSPAARPARVPEAGGIAVLPEDQGPVAEGDRLDVVPLHGLL